MKRIHPSSTFLKSILGASVLLVAFAAAPTLAAPCAEVEIVRAPELVKAGHGMGAVAVGINCGERGRLWNVNWVLVNEAGERTLLRKAPERFRSDKRRRMNHQMIVPRNMESGNYALHVYIGFEPIASDGVSIEVKGIDPEPDPEP